MKNFFTVAASLLAVCSTALAASSEGFIGSSPISANHSQELNEYIIIFSRDEAVEKRKTEEYLRMVQLENKNDTVVFEGDNGVVDVLILNICREHAEQLEKITEIDLVEKKTTIQSYEQKSGAPWGLQRISSEAGATGSPQGEDFTYSFDDASLGAGVDIYILDTGVRTTHAVFTGRATEGFTATGSFVDGDGHGTHCAGTAAGAKFGVAQGANVIEVKVLGDDGSGSSSDTIAGMNFVIKEHQKRKTQPGFAGSVMSMSWGLQGTAKTVDEMIIAASEAGIHVSVAAGNDGVDACGSSPAHLGGGQSNSAVVTVGSVNIDNQISTFSNIGQCVDIYAPGEQILSAWATGDTVINFLSGTSMACPHTTGVMAYLLAQDPALAVDPPALKAKLLQTARQGKLTGSTGGSANLLLSNGVDGNVAKRLVKNYVVPDRSGSPAARAAATVSGRVVIDKRFQLHSRDTTLRF